MDLADQISIAKRLLGHIEKGTTDLAPAQRKVPIDAYLDIARWQREVENIYRSLPIVAGLSCEISQPGSYKALTIVDAPVLLTRDERGELRAFLNVCRHRSALVVPGGTGKAKRFSCPSHGWTYDHNGCLVGVTDAHSFGPVDRANRGLTKLWVAERAGIIFICLTPGKTFDIDAWLAGIDSHMGQLFSDPLCYVAERQLDAGNWKLAMEGHLEGYHFNGLHRDSVAKDVFNNCSTVDRFGPHVLVTFANRTILQLKGIPEEQWRPLEQNHFVAQYVLFPGGCFTIFQGGIVTQTVRPGAEIDRATCTLQLARTTPGTGRPEDAEAERAPLDIVADLVRDEDYPASFSIGQGLRSKAQEEIIIGRNEPCLTYFHDAVDHYASA